MVHMLVRIANPRSHWIGIATDTTSETADSQSVSRIVLVPFSGEHGTDNNPYVRFAMSPWVCSFILPTRVSRIPMRAAWLPVSITISRCTPDAEDLILLPPILRIDLGTIQDPHGGGVGRTGTK